MLIAFALVDRACVRAAFGRRVRAGCPTPRNLHCPSVRALALPARQRRDTLSVGAAADSEDCDRLCSSLGGSADARAMLRCPPTSTPVDSAQLPARHVSHCHLYSVEMPLALFEVLAQHLVASQTRSVPTWRCQYRSGDRTTLTCRSLYKVNTNTCRSGGRSFEVDCSAVYILLQVT